MAKTISAAVSSGETLPSAASRLSITSTGLVRKAAGSSGAEIHDLTVPHPHWVVTNSGRAIGNTPSCDLPGISLDNAGTTSMVIINGSDGVIGEGNDAIITDGAVSVTNAVIFTGTAGRPAVHPRGRFSSRNPLFASAGSGTNEAAGNPAAFAWPCHGSMS